MTNAAPTIVRIIAVRDTRDVIEVGDRFVPVPGSGQSRECDRCGRDHEVHVDVELSNGRTAVIGSGCARGESMDVQARIKSAVSAAKTRARLAAELGAARAAHAAAVAAWDEVKALPLPEIAIVGQIDGRDVYGMGGATVWTWRDRGFDEERRTALINGWRHDRYAERGHKRAPYSYEQDVRDLEARLAKIERKLAAIK